MSSWVVDMEKKLDDAELPGKVERWPKHCIFRVPRRFKAVNDNVYKPKTVSLGPFHHGDEDLRPMEEHKLRAVRHLLRRDSCKTTLVKLVVAVEEVAEELQDAYMDLGHEWRGKENRGKFLEMMITDGCFLLEVMRTAATLEKEDLISTGDYADLDPVFSWHGIQHIKPFVQRDMLMVENQLPLRLLQKIVAMEKGEAPSEASINSMVLSFMEEEDASEGTDLGLHPLDIYRTSQLMDTFTRTEGSLERMMSRSSSVVVPRSAWELYESGIRFKSSESRCLNTIRLEDRGCLWMPIIQLDDSTAYRFHNMMAFEAIHIGTGDDVTVYVLFLKDLIDSAEDVRLLERVKILKRDLADHDRAAVVRLFNRLTMNVPKTWQSQLWHLREKIERDYRMNRYHRNRVRVFLYESWVNLRSKHFSSPWKFLALVTATLLVVADMVQAVYAVISYYKPDKDDPKMH